MNWRDRLLPASFRGVGFWIDQAKTPVGRKGQLHEYPQRDLPYFEDLGQQAKIHDITAFIVGADCLEQRDKLLKALEAGSGELVHPWLGRLQVKVGECDMTHTRQDGGLVTFALKFYPDKPLPFPTATVSTQKVLLAKADTLLGSAVARFEQAMTLIKAARIGIANLRNSLTGVYEVIKEQLKPLIEQYRQITELVKAVKELPKEVAAEFKGLLGDIKELKAFAKEGYRGVIADVSQQLEAIRKADAPKITTGKDTNAAAQAMADLVQDTLLVKVAQWVASMPVASPAVKLLSTPSVAHQADRPVTRQEVPVTEEMKALQKAVGAAIDPMLDKADPKHHQAINDVKEALIAHLKAVASSGVRQVSKSFQESLPALVVAYQQFADATRVTEVTQSNAMNHPGFAPNDVKVSRE
ncbi:DNA circularization N-terminal domain-containing protein [Pseudomonas granadensis]|uniref:DNA circularization N-terminal domain-containing protein n=1 Tax=Pseudomonas granadensis TaxID=1421430 RepID=A0ABX7GJA5_9PSED|nr:DNA circularization N-terminal domain-containing protein [Pseudomonas granadensis]MBN6775524.1 DNA circularization N-terminal domain-containing protein [Pseudomonas granadensis]MBN6806817.1 DNA circularization N-terminal domain-containing protein [Pseudomonas granadensis]MBN6833526.1 DNA circularization N-terminal domain-containing protein [Pseudomonas granadensis]MBN6841063.1 DNA circularization N-terminal domain-containing protein [Pseudomonas granadensis]MBN6866534.1 DNA circularization 